MNRLAVVIALVVLVVLGGSYGCLLLLVPGVWTDEVEEVPDYVQRYMGINLVSCGAFDTIYYQDSGIDDNLFEVSFRVRGDPESCFQHAGYADVTWSAGVPDYAAAHASMPTALDSSNVIEFNRSSHAGVDVAAVDRTFSYEYTGGFGYIACDGVCRVGIWVYSM